MYKMFCSLNIKGVHLKGIEVIVYESKIEDGSRFFNSLVVNNLVKFKEMGDVIVANRPGKEMEDKVYTRDLVKRD